MAPMTVERHYDDEALISLLEAGRNQSDTHLPSCTVCREKLDSFSMIAGALHDHAVWDTRAVNLEPVPATITNLRAFADRMTTEDTAATAILAELLAGPREEWMPRLHAHPEWRTAGVVRGLIAATNRAIDTMPPDAVELTTLATEIADHLDVTTHPSDTVHRLRGAAWRERGYALFYTGQARQALVAVERSETAFSRCVVDEFDRARVGIVKALTLRLLERFDEAAAAAGESAALFVDFDDLGRVASTRLAQVHLLFSKGEYASAEPILAELDRQLADSSHVETHARVLINVGYCAGYLGNVDAALKAYELAGALFDALDIPTESLRARWNATLMLAEAGRLKDACSRLEGLGHDMEQQGMFSEATLNDLRIAELLLDQGRLDDVARLCRAAMQRFERAGLGYTARALTALAYIREAARDGVATPLLVRSVREYIRELPSQPNVLFAPPPS